MRKISGKLALALALGSVLLLTGVSYAADTIVVRVVENSQPVEGAAVEVIATDGSTSHVTDANGEATQDLSGRLFRVKVNGEIFGGIHDVNEGVVVIELN